MDLADERARLISEMASRFPRFPRPTIERLVHRIYEQHLPAQVQTFVPILARRAVMAQLRYLDT